MSGWLWLKICFGGKRTCREGNALCATRGQHDQPRGNRRGDTSRGHFPAGHGELAAPVIWVCFVFSCLSATQGLKWGGWADRAGKAWRTAALRKLGRERRWKGPGDKSSRRALQWQEVNGKEAQDSRCGGATLFMEGSGTQGRRRSATDQGRSAGWSPARGSARQGTASTAGCQCSFLLPIFYRKPALSVKD